MKRMLVFFLLLILFSSHFQSIFAAFQEEEPHIDTLLPRVQEIFEVRTEVWNKILEDSGKRSLTKIQEELVQYVEGPLLREDMRTFKQMLENPTSYEKIKNFRIDECSPLELEKGIMKLHMNIVWELESYEDYGISDKTSVNYVVELSENNGKWFLWNYRVVQQMEN
ncbi:hypothetical protein [Alkaliphilus hydrothermalis]|uniref:Vesicle coat complex subunit n=1 Tax=Alkaliphilus hydrothermalis TaxID=1482730 RepID=A0ABS2NPL3_9FIRM|nr:hypothetical protein [Alkaliphilus hydrothermalis]MBM7614839.1 vesicle coat complex subunit [Alkaliphilus hydrothermalis]